MSDVLSQAEVDALISSLSKGEVQTQDEPEKQEETKNDKLKRYDFKTPSKFSKEQVRTLQIVHENFARNLGNFLSAYLRTPIQVSVVSVKQTSYGEFINALPSPTLLVAVQLSTELGTGIIETSPQFVFPLIDLLCGGVGEVVDEPRESTEIEQTMIQAVFTKILDNLKDAWGDVYELSPSIENMETNPHYNQTFASNETTILITLSVQIGNNQGFINICLPFITLEPVISRLSARHWFRGNTQKIEGDKFGTLVKRIEKTEAETIVILGKTVVNMEDFLGLQVGDVLSLNKKAGEGLDLYVRNSLKHKVQPGIVGKKMAVRIEGEGVVQDNEG